MSTFIYNGGMERWLANFNAVHRTFVNGHIFDQIVLLADLYCFISESDNSLVEL